MFFSKKYCIYLKTSQTSDDKGTTKSEYIREYRHVYSLRVDWILTSPLHKKGKGVEE